MRVGVVLSAAVAFALMAAPAMGGGLQESVFQDDDQLLHGTPERADETLDELRALGVDRVRVSVIWRNLAPKERPSRDPADPRAYPAEQFDALDHLVRAARLRGIGVLLNVRGGAPDWALGRRPPKKLAGRDAFKPDPVAFGRFAAMLGHRYGGSYEDENQGGRPLPRVAAWSVWNEPNWGGHLQPQSRRVRRNARRSRLQTVAPARYRRLYREAAAGLRATGHGDDVLLLGETAPIGSRKLGQLAPLPPVRFLRDLFCLNRRNRPVGRRRARRLRCDFERRGALPATGYAHHPYPVTQAPGDPSPDRQWVKLADAGRLEALLDAAAAAGRIPAGLPLWYTEFGYQTDPPDPHRGVGLEVHADWLAEAERIAWSNPRVAAMTQFLLVDDEPRTIYPADDRRRWATYQTGLRFEDGRAKPAYAAYRLPLVGRSDELWGMVRPGANGEAQTIRIEHRAGEGEAWQAVAERSVTDPRGYFAEPLPAGPGSYRVLWVRPRPGGLLGGFQTEPEPVASRAVTAGRGRAGR